MQILALTKLYFADSLKALGHRVITVGFNRKNFELYDEDIKIGTRSGTDSVLLKGFDYFFEYGSTLDAILSHLPADFEPEVIIYFDDSNNELYVTGLENSSAPTLFYTIDTHLHPEEHPILGGLFDKVLVAQSDYVAACKAYNENSEWFPLWCRAYVEPFVQKTTSVAFRGNLETNINPQRKLFLEKVARMIPVDFGTGPFCKVYASSKIVLNQTIRGDLNFRVFEGMACGALMLTPRIGNNQSTLFTPGMQLIAYQEGDDQEALKEITFYLEHDGARCNIAAQGREIVTQFHLETQRVKQLDLILSKLEKSERRQAALCSAYNSLLRARVQFFVFNNRQAATDELSIVSERLLSAGLSTDAESGFLLTLFLLGKRLQIELGEERAALELCRKIWRKFSANSYLHGPLTATCLYTLMQHGCEAEARDLAIGISGQPDQLLTHAQQLGPRLDEPAINMFTKDRRTGQLISPGKFR